MEDSNVDLHGTTHLRGVERTKAGLGGLKGERNLFEPRFLCASCIVNFLPRLRNVRARARSDTHDFFMQRVFLRYVKFIQMTHTHTRYRPPISRYAIIIDDRAQSRKLK